MSSSQKREASEVTLERERKIVSRRLSESKKENIVLQKEMLETRKENALLKREVEKLNRKIEVREEYMIKFRDLKIDYK